jgi:hypothetical protein
MTSSMALFADNMHRGHMVIIVDIGNQKYMVCACSKAGLDFRKPANLT